MHRPVIRISETMCEFMQLASTAKAQDGMMFDERSAQRSMRLGLTSFNEPANLGLPFCFLAVHLSLFCSHSMFTSFSSRFCCLFSVEGISLHGTVRDFGASEELCSCEI
jgi:hypothetical protein